MRLDSVTQLSQWYRSHCDGDWEHDDRIALRTVDNPGWRLTVNLQGTYGSIPELTRIEVEHSAIDWYSCWLDGFRFEAAGGPENLPDMLNALCEWLATFDPNLSGRAS